MVREGTTGVTAHRCRPLLYAGVDGPLWFRDGAPGSKVGDPDTDVREDEGDGAYPFLYCAWCSHLITSEAERIEVAGSHGHTLFNPAGIVFELGCFKKAPGCHVGGQPSTEFSWFAGHVWQLALCSGCGEHLGWYFTAAGTSFFGLIFKNLRRGFQ